MDAAVYKDCKSLVKTPRCSEFPLCSPRYPRIPLSVTAPFRPTLLGIPSRVTSPNTTHIRNKHPFLYS